MKISVVLFIATCLFLSCNDNAGNTFAGSDSDKATQTPAPAENAQPVTDSLHAPDTLFKDGSIPTSWENAGFSDPVAFKTFIMQLKDWVRNDNMDSIAAHIQFPLKNVKTADAFKKDYNKLFNEKIKTAIAAQRVDRVFRNSSGAMIGSGELWFIENKGNYYITAINAK